MNEEKPGFWAILPAVVRYDKSLPPMARLLYAEISSLCNRNGKQVVADAYDAYLKRLNEP